jgi:hypothetical protein
MKIATGEKCKKTECTYGILPRDRDSPKIPTPKQVLQNHKKFPS